MTALVSPPMASSDRSPVRYHTTGPTGNHLQLFQYTVRTVAGAIVQYLRLTDGGNTIVLSQANATDLGAGISNFGSNGVLS